MDNTISSFDDINNILNFTKRMGLYPRVHIMQSAAEPEVLVDGKKYLLFCSNNFLGLSTHPRVIRAANEALTKYGIGAGGSRLLSGSFVIHLELEKTLASFKKGEDAIIFASGYSTNIGVLSAFLDVFTLEEQEEAPASIVYSDELNHASIIDGCRFSGARIIKYKHCDINDLKNKLIETNRDRARKLIVTDGVFSMDGDIASLPEIVSLGKEFGCSVMVDEAHSTGTIGKRGAGVVDYFNLEGQVDIDMGTCSKAFGAIGGFVVGSKILVDYLRIAARSYMFSAAMSPVIASAINEGIKVIQEEPGLRLALSENASYLRNGLQRLGFDTLNSSTQIIPILLKDDEKSIQATDEFYNRGIIAPNVRWPAVPKGSSRIRLVVMATHTKQQIDKLLNVAEDIGKKLEVI